MTHGHNGGGSPHNMRRDERRHMTQRPGELAHRHDHDGEQDEEQFEEDVFWYTLAFGNIVAGGTAQDTLQIDADAHFKVTKLTYYATLHSGSAPFSDNNIPELSLTIRDGGAGRDLVYSPIPFSSIAGTARLPALLALHRIFKAKATINMTVANFSASNQYDNVQVTLWGTKLFPNKG